MPAAAPQQLLYYIPLSAIPGRRPADGTEPYLRPEVGFNPNWFHVRCGTDFSERWHEDPDYRWETLRVMTAEVRQRFPGHPIGGASETQPPRDLLTGIFGAAAMGKLLGLSIRYFPNAWPANVGAHLTDDAVVRFEPPELEANPFFQGILRQVDRAAELTGSAEGYLHWQGVLNTAYRLRGETIFTDLIEEPARAHRVFEIVTTTMIAGARALYAHQRRRGFEVRFLSVANCMLNMIGPAQYREHLLQYDLRLRDAFDVFGIHNCAWSIDPHMDTYAGIRDLAYIDMGLESDLRRARRLFPRARRNLLYTPMDLKNKPWSDIRADLDRIAADLGPCDLGLPDIEADIPDERVLTVLEHCRELSNRYGRHTAEGAS
ncbi:MAG: Uroporphyrinogen decarboxylase [candidate division NC10 bacterium]|nr:Uroporphyrinogen decarboxylase [candidate division NC10 bacterium]